MPAMRLDAVYLPGGFAMNSSLLRTLRRMTLFGQPDFNNSNLRELRLRPQVGLCTISGCRSGFVWRRIGRRLVSLPGALFACVAPKQAHAYACFVLAGDD